MDAEPSFHPEQVMTEEPSGRRALGSLIGSDAGGAALSRTSVIPTRSVVCHVCGRVSEVPAAALSAHCIHCRVHLAMGDVSLFPGSSKTRVYTQGDVTIHPNAVLSHLDIHCHNLLMKGTASGNFVCSGVLDIHSKTAVSGAVRAHTLRLREKSHAVFRKAVMVHNAVIEGTLEGKLEATGSITVAETGVFLGDVKAGALTVRPGGVHRGHLPRQ